MTPEELAVWQQISANRAHLRTNQPEPPRTREDAEHKRAEERTARKRERWL